MVSGNPEVYKYGFGSKHRTKEQDDEYRSRCSGVPKKRVWTKTKCLEQLDVCFTSLKSILTEAEKVNKNDPKKLKAETVRDLNTMINRILDFMKYLYPPVNENINLNINTTAEAVIERLKNWKKYEGKEEEMIVVEDKKDE